MNEIKHIKQSQDLFGFNNQMLNEDKENQAWIWWMKKAGTYGKSYAS